MAWELAAIARPHASRSEADQVHIAIGIGETFTAIDALLTAVARNRIPLGEDLLGTLATWLDCHHGQPAVPRLHQLLAEVRTASAQPKSAVEERLEAMLAATEEHYRRSG